MGNFTASSPYCDQGLETMKDDSENDSLHELLRTYNFPTSFPSSRNIDLSPTSQIPIA